MSGAADPAPAVARADARHWARAAAIQMLYQWEIGRLHVDQVAARFFSEHVEPVEDDGEMTVPVPDVPPVQRPFAIELFRGVVTHVARLDPLIAAAAEHWRLERMAVVDRLILRLAVYEFLYRPETPGRVVINEALELARTFSTEDAVRFINGLLDAVRKTLASAEDA